MNGNTATFTVATSGTRSFAYDLNGNMTNDGQKTYSWDGASRLVKITYSGTGNYTEFMYDGGSRRVRIKEVESGTTASDKRFVWDGLSIAERRAADGTTVERRYYGQGFQQSGTSSPESHFYVPDHLGSIRAVIDESGVERGRWTYGLWGSRSANQITVNPVEVDFGYTGHYNHERSGLVSAPFRFYDPATIRWLSRDPIGEAGGFGLYMYVSNNPLNRLDPLGLVDNWFFGLGPILGPIAFAFTENSRAPAFSPFPEGDRGQPSEGWYRHCVNACHLNRMIGNSFGPLAWLMTEFCAEVAGRDLPGQSTRDLSDIDGNGAGIMAAQTLNSCEAECAKRHPSNPKNIK